MKSFKSYIAECEYYEKIDDDHVTEGFLSNLFKSAATKQKEKENAANAHNRQQINQLKKGYKQNLKSQIKRPI